MSIEDPRGQSHRDIWEREARFMRTKEYTQARDHLAPLYHEVATNHLTLPWQLLSYVNAEGFTVRLRWSEHELPDPATEADHAGEMPPYSYLEVNSNYGVNLLQFLRRKPNGEMYMQQLSPGAIHPNRNRIQKALVKDLQTPYISTDATPPGWVTNVAMTLWIPEKTT